MLTLSYAQCLNDPTYCDDGKTGGALLIKQFNIRSNTVMPLATVFPHVKLYEGLWCLRIVKPLQQKEANSVAWNFINACASMFAATATADILDYCDLRAAGARCSVQEKHDLVRRYKDSTQPLHKITRMILSDLHPSQIAIDVMQETVKQAKILHDDDEAEMKLRNVFRRLL